MLETLYHLGMDTDDSIVNTLSASGSCGVVSSAMKMFLTTNLVEHRELLMQAVLLAIVLMRGKTEVSKLNAQALYSDGVCCLLASFLKSYGTDKVHVAWICTCVATMCARYSDSQRVFFDTSFGTMLWNYFVTAIVRRYLDMRPLFAHCLDLKRCGFPFRTPLKLYVNIWPCAIYMVYPENINVV